MATAAEIRRRNCLPEGVPTSSPWGTVQSGEILANGIIAVSTASHGGIKVYAKHNKLIPEVFRSPDGWYEEDLGWAIVFHFLPDIFTDEKDRAHARKTLRSWYWKEWERHYGEEIPLSESPHKASDLWKEANKDKWQTVSAYGDTSKNVPKGMVGVVASPGGSYNVGREERYYLVPAEEYARRTENPSGSIIIDPDRHQEWCGPYA